MGKRIASQLYIYIITKGAGSLIIFVPCSCSLIGRARSQFIGACWEWRRSRMTNATKGSLTAICCWALKTLISSIFFVCCIPVTWDTENSWTAMLRVLMREASATDGLSSFLWCSRSFCCSSLSHFRSSALALSSSSTSLSSTVASSWSLLTSSQVISISYCIDLSFLFYLFIDFTLASVVCVYLPSYSTWDPSVSCSSTVLC